MSELPIVVIADDLSGAAELAGIAALHGLTAEVQTRFQQGSDANVIAVDTDSRGLLASEAAAKVQQVAFDAAAFRPAVIFKKVDSVLRGNVSAEIEAILAATGLRKAVLAPANPSRGRTIEGGQYLVAGRPLDQTEFLHDPEHPRWTANVAVQLGGPADRITVPDVASLSDLDRLAAALEKQTLPAGAADFFAALLRHRGFAAVQATADSLRLERPAVLVCGSLAAWSARKTDCNQAGLPVVSLHSSGWKMPASDLTDRCMQIAESRGALVLAPGDIAIAPELRRQAFERFTCDAAEVVARSKPRTVLAEGGATAAALARHLGWRRLATVAAAPAGVGVLRPFDSNFRPVLLVKPGSYPWPESIWRQFTKLL